MITGPTADDAPDGYWSNPNLEKLGQKWKFRGVEGYHKHLGDALASSEKFMENYLSYEVDYICDMVKDGDEAVYELWENHCKYAMNRAGYETEQEWITAYTEYARLAPKDDVYQWAYKRTMDDVGDYWALIRDLCHDSECDLRKDHPIVGVWSASYDTVFPIESVLGWCPTCNGPLVRADISWGRDIQGSGEEVEIFVCPDCGCADPVNGNDGKGFDAKWGRPFHLPIHPALFEEVKFKETTTNGNETVIVYSPIDTGNS